MITQESSSRKTSEFQDSLTVRSRTHPPWRDRLLERLDYLRNLSGLTCFEERFIDQMTAEICSAEVPRPKIKVLIWRRHKPMPTPYKIHTETGVHEFKSETLVGAINNFSRLRSLEEIQRVELLNGWGIWQDVPERDWKAVVKNLTWEEVVQCG